MHGATVKFMNRQPLREFLVRSSRAGLVCHLCALFGCWLRYEAFRPEPEISVCTWFRLL